MLVATPTAGAQTLERDIEVTDAAGLEWLTTHQNGDGSFADGDVGAHTGPATLKFEDRAIDLGYNPLTPPTNIPTWSRVDSNTWLAQPSQTRTTSTGANPVMRYSAQGSS